MEQPVQFRSSLNGFNREDVVRYMEYIYNKHSAQVAQLTNELESLRSKQDAMDSNRSADLEKQLAAALQENNDLKHRIAALEHSLQEANAALAKPCTIPQAAAPTESELEAYRRAERVERVAKERARQVSQQTAQALSTVSSQLDETAEQLMSVNAQLMQQLEQLQDAVANGRQAVQDAAGMVERLNDEII